MLVDDNNKNIVEIDEMTPREGFAAGFIAALKLMWAVLRQPETRP